MEIWFEYIKIMDEYINNWKVNEKNWWIKIMVEYE